VQRRHTRGPANDLAVDRRRDPDRLRNGVGDLGIDALSKIRHVFLMHAHLDYIAALPWPVDTLFERFMRQPPTVHCQFVTYRSLKRHNFNAEIWPDFLSYPQARRRSWPIDH
jgi:glyoxylase-like metal-dependent hydrolase (beta-lactamase superfamily II)